MVGFFQIFFIAFSSCASRTGRSRYRCHYLTMGTLGGYNVLQLQLFLHHQPGFRMNQP